MIKYGLGMLIPGDPGAYQISKHSAVTTKFTIYKSTMLHNLQILPFYQLANLCIYEPKSLEPINFAAWWPTRGQRTCCIPDLYHMMSYIIAFLSHVMSSTVLASVFVLMLYKAYNLVIIYGLVMCARTDE